MSTASTSSARVIIIRLTRNLMRPTTSFQLPRMTMSTIRSIDSEPDPFAAVDKLNGGAQQHIHKLSRTKSSSSKPSTSIPLSVTTGSPGQSSAIESHPSTSIQDLHPLPSSTSQLVDGDHHSTYQHPHPHDSSIPRSADLSDGTINWASSFSGLSQKPFSKEASDVLMAPIDPMDVEIKPDGVIYLPEIKYRRILNRAFGPGGWGLAPRGEYGLVCLGRLVSLARGEQDYYNGADNIPTATEGCKSNALMRCCKDLGIASELWDPNYIQWWKNKFATVEWSPASGLSSGKKKAVWKKKRTGDWTPNLS